MQSTVVLGFREPVVKRETTEAKSFEYFIIILKSRKNFNTLLKNKNVSERISKTFDG